MQTLASDKSRIIDAYIQLRPSARKVKRTLSFADGLSAEEQSVSKYLIRYVDELSYTSLKQFLRFCTGSDLIIKEKIYVRFVDLDGLARRPVAHTCGCVIEIPKKYDSFMDFRKELNNVLQSNIWVMDIV
jgi:hypothetical protein